VIVKIGRGFGRGFIPK